MNSYERVFAAFRGEQIDCYPAICPTSVVTNQLMKSENTFFPIAHLHPIETFYLSQAVHKTLGFDSISPYFSIHLEASALGTQIDWSDKKGMPQVIKRPSIDIEDYKIPNDFLERKEIKYFVNIIKDLNKKYDKKVALIGKVIGPWTLAYHLFGVENLIMKTILEPLLIKNLIKELSKAPIEFAKRQFENGADFVVWAEHVTSDLVSPEIYREFVLPVHQKAALELSCYGPTILHVCGDLKDRISQLSLSNIDMLHIDSRNDFKASMEKIENDMQLVGFINNPYLLRKGSTAEIRKKTISLLKEGVTFVAPECAIPFSVPNKNLIELTKTLHQFNPDTIKKISLN